MSMRKWFYSLSPEARRKVRRALLVLGCAAVIAVALLLLRCASALQDIFRAGLTDIYLN